MKRSTVHVNDRMQKEYVYECIEPVGKHFDLDFSPQLTPREMLAIGVFGGKYMRDCVEEFPASWFASAKLLPEHEEKPDASLNYFGVHASQSLSQWRAKGWIYPDDPRGWFQWYCRYYMGRRIANEDKRQIKRWNMMRRHAAQVMYGCKPGDMHCRPRQRQALLHWAYDPRRI